jgi:MATE family multidrug resistance protein
MAKTQNYGILHLALPAILTNITVPLLGICDTAISGHLGDASFIGGISVGSMIINSIYWLFSFLRMGTTGLTATAYGMGSRKAIRTVLRRAVMIALATALLILLFRHQLLDVMLRITHPDKDVEGLASQYFSICIWTAPAQLATMAITGWFIGMQTTVVPMVIAVGTNIVNIAASLLLVFAASLGFTGVAYGTLIAQYVGAVAAVIFFLCYYKKMSSACSADDSQLDLTPFGWGRFFKVNTNLFFRSLFMIIVSMTMTSVAARIGDNELAVNAIGVQFWLFYSYFMDGFAFAGEALVGRFTGAADYRSQREVIRRLLLWGAGVAALFTIIYLIWYSDIVGLLTNVESVRATAERLRVWITILPAITVAAFILDGVYVGLTHTREMMTSTLIGCVLFIVIAFFIGTKNNAVPSLEVLWTAFETYLLARGVYLSALLKYVTKPRENAL